jgi:hypothetical protein
VTRPKNEPLPETCGDKRGTLTGKTRHQVAGELLCDACREAERAYQENYRKRRGTVPSQAAGQRVRNRALRALAREHPEDYRRLLDAEWIAETKRQGA